MMPPVIRLVALGTVLAILGAAAVLIYAAVLRYRGRDISPPLVRLGAGFEGAACAFGFLFMPDLRFIALFLAIPVYLVYRLLRRGQRIAAGALLMALGSLGAVWWGYYLVQDAFDPFISYDPALWLWWAPEVALLVVGAFLIARGDREVAPPTLFATSASQVREPAAVGSAIMRAMSIGPFPIQVIIGLGAGVPVIAFLAVGGSGRLPWPIGPWPGVADAGSRSARVPDPAAAQGPGRRIVRADEAVACDDGDLSTSHVASHSPMA
jgi:hypothetical protein